MIGCEKPGCGVQGGPPGPACQTRQPPPEGAQPPEGVAELPCEPLAKTDNCRSTRRLPQVGQVTPSLPEDIGCSFWKSWWQCWQRYS